MTESIFRIGAEGVDAAGVVEKIRAAVDEKRKQGVYNDARIARAERSNLANLRDDDNFFASYLECLREAVFVDISDFDIVERRSRFSGFFVTIKKFVWKLLKFYTYRLWSQQNQTNGLLLGAIEEADRRYLETIERLEKRLSWLEQKNGAEPGESPSDRTHSG